VDQAFHDAQPASAGSFGLARGVLLRALSIEPTSGTSVATGSPATCFRASRSDPNRQDRFPRVSREGETSAATQDAFPRWGTLTHVREPSPISCAVT